MMNLTIETDNKFRAGDIENAYNEAMNTCNIESFIQSIKAQMPNTIVYRGGNHIFISEKDGNRIAIITNI